MNDSSQDWVRHLDDRVIDWLHKAREARQRSDWEAARFAYQKCAFGNVRTSGPEQAHAKKMLITEQALFAAQEPLFCSVLVHVKNALAEVPGIKQTDFYTRIPYKKEEVSYTLYFAEILGWVRREKKGNTYLLFPAQPNQPGELQIPEHF